MLDTHVSDASWKNCNVLIDEDGLHNLGCHAPEVASTRDEKHGMCLTMVDLALLFFLLLVLLLLGSCCLHDTQGASNEIEKESACNDDHELLMREQLQEEKDLAAEHFEEQLKRVRREAEKKDEELNMLTDELRRKEREKEDELDVRLRMKDEELNKTKSMFEAKHKEIAKEKEEKERELESIRRDLEKELKEKQEAKKKCESEKQGKDEEIVTLRKLLSEKTNGLVEEQQRHLSTKGHLEQMDSQLQSVTQQLAEKNERIAHLSQVLLEKHEEKKNQFDSSEKDLTEKETKIVQLQAEIEASRIAFTDLKNQLNIQSEQLLRVKTESDEKENNVKAVNETNRQLSEKVAEMRTLIIEAEEKVTSTQKERDELSSRLKNQEEEARHAKKCCKEREIQIEELKQGQSDKEEAENVIQELKKKLDELRIEIEGKEEKVKKKIKALEKTELHAKELREELQRQKELITFAEALNLKKEEEIQQLKKEHEEYQQQMKQELALHVHEVKALNERRTDILERHRKEMEDALEKHCAKEQEVKALVNENISLQTMIQQLSEELTTTKNELEKCKEEGKRQEEIDKQYVKELDHLRSELSVRLRAEEVMKQEIELKDHRLLTIETDQKKVSEELTSALKEIDDLRTRITELERLIAELQSVKQQVEEQNQNKLTEQEREWLSEARDDEVTQAGVPPPPQPPPQLIVTPRQVFRPPPGVNWDQSFLLFVQNTLQ